MQTLEILPDLKIFSLSIINSFIFTMIAYHILLGLCQDTLCTVTTEKNDNINLPYRKLLILHCVFPIKSPSRYLCVDTETVLKAVEVKRTRS